MSQKTETDLRELKDLINALDKKIDLGFAEVKGEFKEVNARLTLVEASITKLDGRLWGFIGLALTVTLGSLLTVFIRFMFANTPNI
ncbi:hypothetical protein [Chamaesiphon polymorphus]|uniref:Uncharacterized protein n=1 Tax=Chamaesiphon polymorphus CCALA 037 TaxID=2107692 RepID=A0A2T1GF23_9CYAN|nr:hypothetical protein [Chamaesiphon polymorphus]PSB56192.1 hypothetical protein C7B77_12705 [Chamaesiphon polymorphus CCALA 037]